MFAIVDPEHPMTTRQDLIDIAARLEGTVVGEGEQFALGFIVKGKHRGYCWSWLERLEPKKKRIPNDRVLAVRVPNLEIKEMLLAANPDTMFTEPHYDGYAAVLVRLDLITPEDLEPLLAEAAACTLTKKSKR